MDNVKKNEMISLRNSLSPLWFNSWLLWHRSACFASALMYFCLPCLSVSTQQQAKIHKSWPINKCHFLNAETPWECKQKVFPWMPFNAEGCLSVVERPADSIRRRRRHRYGGVVLSAACVCIFIKLLMVRNKTKHCRQKQTISILCIESVRITASTHGLKRENCLSHRFSARAFFHERGRIWKMMLTDGRSFHREQ